MLDSCAKPASLDVSSTRLRPRRHASRSTVHASPNPKGVSHISPGLRRSAVFASLPWGQSSSRIRNPESGCIMLYYGLARLAPNYWELEGHRFTPGATPKRFHISVAMLRRLASATLGQSSSRISNPESGCIVAILWRAWEAKSLTRHQFPSFPAPASRPSECACITQLGVNFTHWLPFSRSHHRVSVEFQGAFRCTFSV